MRLTYHYVDNKLSEIKTDFPYQPYDVYGFTLTYLEKFYYDQNGNLIKTEHFKQQNGVNTGEKTVRVFGNYDNAQNPFKRLQFLDDYFYRSISKNNFRQYDVATYYNDELRGLTSTTWTFKYDSNGQIIVE